MSQTDRLAPWLDYVAAQVREAGDLTPAHPPGVQPPRLPLRGKLVRARLLLLAADALGVLDRPAADLAAGVEMIHNASLLHDDVIDQATMRRGETAVYRANGNRFAIMAGDVCFSKAMELICRANCLPVHQAVARAVADLSTGQLTEWVRRGDAAMSFADYFDIVDRKTGALIALCLETPGILAGLAAAPVGALHDAGRLLGRAFQIADDMLDLDAEQAETGKDVYADLAEGKPTYPYLLILHGGDRRAAALVRRALGDPHFPAAELRAAIFANGLRQDVQTFLRDCVERSRAMLEPVFGPVSTVGLFRHFEDLAFRRR
jgi:octaprenyl-diphosphate synthase